MTYMSMAQALQALQVAKVLVPYVPSRTRRLPKRRLYLTTEALHDLNDPNSALNLLAQSKPYTRARIVAGLDRWVLGDRIFLSQKARFLCRLTPSPTDVWELRITDPTPQVRLFGRFLEPDTLVITKCHMRNHLGDRGSRTWTTAMRACAGQWTQIFPTMAPFTSANIHEYITENCDDYGPDCHPPPGTQRTGRVRRRTNSK